MIKKLTAKIQKLNPNLVKSSKLFSKAIIIEPDSKSLLLKKGTIHAIFDITSPFDFDVELVTKVVTDVLHDSYFSSESISPIQSLEKAIVELKDKVYKISPEATKTKELQIEFNILAGVLWGNVMYIVQYGKGVSYLVRTGEIKSLSTTTEGNFSAASGVVKDEDVLVFCTEGFAAKFAPQKLLTTAVAIDDLDSSESCLILKFVVDLNFTQDEVVSFATVKSQKRIRAEQLLEKVQLAFVKIINIRKTKARKTQREEIRDLGIKVKRAPQFSLKFTSVAIIPTLILLLTISIAYSIIKKSKTPDKSAPQITQEVSQTTQSAAAVISISAPTQPEDKSIIKKNFEVHYDIKITDPDASPTTIAALNNTVVVADTKTGKMFTSTTAIPKFDAISKTFPGIANLINIGGKIGFSDTEGYKVYDTVADKIVENYSQPGLGVTTSYLGFIYSLSGDKITKYTKSGTVLTPSLWAQSADFSGAKSLDIAVSIFILKESGGLVSYTKGIKDTFETTGLDKPFNNPKQVFTSIDLDNIYVVDYGNKRIVLLDKTGRYVKQYVNDNTDSWADIRAITISPKADKMYVLSGSKVFVVTL